MAKELKIGIQTNGIKHSHSDPLPDVDTRFRMSRKVAPSTMSTRPQRRMKSNNSLPPAKNMTSQCGPAAGFIPLAGTRS
jgi:hypothetical protein